MGLRKIIIDFFDPLDPLDDNQKSYREAFGIMDRYLLNYTIDSNDKGFIIFIDRQYDIDWADKGFISTWSDDEQATFYDAIGKLDAAQTYPCEILSKQKKLNFKRILGTAYVDVFHKNYNTIETSIKQAQDYVNERSMEKARTIFLTVATACIFLFLIAFYLQRNGGTFLPWSINVSAAILFGTAGAYTSIWSRFSELKMKGLSTKFALVVESLSRLLVGCISAIVMIMAFKTDFVLSVLKDKEPIYVYSVIAFVAGFSERWLTSIVERFINEDEKQNE